MNSSIHCHYIRFLSIILVAVNCLVDTHAQEMPDLRQINLMNRWNLPAATHNFRMKQ